MCVAASVDEIADFKWSWRIGDVITLRISWPISLGDCLEKGGDGPARAFAGNPTTRFKTMVRSSTFESPMAS